MATKDDPFANLEAKLFETAQAYQQNHYELSGDWNCYKHTEFNYLKDYVGLAMFGFPEPKVDDGSYVYEKQEEKAIKLIYNKVLEHGNRYNSKGNIFCSVIYNVIYNKEKAQKALLTARLEGKKGLQPEVLVYPVPVFKVKQVRTQWKLTEKGLSSKNSEKIYYIDNSGRVYKGFADYLNNNELPKCTMVYPKDGKYQIDPNHAKLHIKNQNIDNFVSVVWLEKRASPADSVASKVLLGGDIATTIVSVGSIGVGMAVMVTPIGPAIAIAAGIGGALSAAWGVGRSAQHLADRGLHDETINPIEDRSAAGAWIGIAGGAVGLAATGGSALLARAIRTGTTISRTATVAYDVVLIGNLMVNGVGISFKSYDMYATYVEKKQILPHDVLMFVGHLFFFFNSVVNLRLAQTIIKSSQGQLLKDYESSLRSNRHRKEFQRIARNTRAAGTDDISSNEEIIRGINKIYNKDEFFQAMVRNRKTLSALSAKAAFSDGKVTVNSKLIIEPIELSNLQKDVCTEIVKLVLSSEPASSPGINANNSPDVFNAFGGVHPVKSESKADDAAGVKPNEVAGTQSKDFGRAKPKLKASSGVPSSNSAEKKLNNPPGGPKESAGSTSNVRAGITLTETATEVKAKIRQQEKFDTSNGTILKEFCTTHPAVMSQAAPPQITDFGGVLKELCSISNYAQIFIILLETAYKIWQALRRQSKIIVGKVLGLIVEFIWDYIKLCIKRQIPKIPIDHPAFRQFLIPAIKEVVLHVEKELDVWVEHIKKWLEEKLPQSVSIPQLKNCRALLN